MIDNPFFSICIPSYNSKSFISETINSVLIQTFKNFELIIVDNASSDSTIDIVKQFQDDRLVLYKNATNIGIHGNHNLCMKYATGKYVHVLSSDDKFLYKDVLEKIYIQITSCQIEPEVIGVLGSSDEVNPLLSEAITKKPNIIGGIDAVRKIFLNQLPFVLIPSLVLFKKDLIYKDNVIVEQWQVTNDISYGDDTEFYLKLIKKSNYLFLDVPLIFYRVHSESVTEVATKSGRATQLHCAMLNRWIREESIIKLSWIEKLWIMSTDYLRLTYEFPDDKVRRKLLKYEFTSIEKIFAILRKISSKFLPIRLKTIIKSNLKSSGA